MVVLDGGEMSGAMDLETFYRDHYDHYDPRDVELRETAIRSLAETCPISSSDAWGGFWVVNSYQLVKDVFSDWETFSSMTPSVVIPRAPGRFNMPPIDVDPPLQRDFRHVLNPFLTPKRIAQFAPGVRDLVSELIDGFIEDGHCDLYGQFCSPFPGRMLYRFVFGIDDTEVPMVQEWTQQALYNSTAPEGAAAAAKWNAWMHDVCERRRHGPRRDDLLDALVHATIDGRPINEEELIGCFSVLILGGFDTTSDSISNTMWRLAQDPSLQARLRDDPDQIPDALDEFLRFDPPIIGLPRVCTRDTELNGQQIKAGERVFMHFQAANRDPAEFADEHEAGPNELDIDRERNRHLSFGLGPHRCIGSNVARQNLRIALEELLGRLGEFQLTPGDEVRHQPTGLWGPHYLPLTFSPGAGRRAG